MTDERLQEERQLAAFDGQCGHFNSPLKNRMEPRRCSPRAQILRFKKKGSSSRDALHLQFSCEAQNMFCSPRS